MSDSSLPLRFNSSESTCGAWQLFFGNAGCLIILILFFLPAAAALCSLLRSCGCAGESMQTTSADTMQRWSSHEGLGPRLSSHFSAEVRVFIKNSIRPLLIFAEPKTKQPLHRGALSCCDHEQMEMRHCTNTAAVQRTFSPVHHAHYVHSDQYAVDGKTVAALLHVSSVTCHRASCVGCPARKLGPLAGDSPARRPAAVAWAAASPAWTAASSARGTPGDACSKLLQGLHEDDLQCSDNSNLSAP